ncbi:MAG: outer membrane protein assembly factor BamE [Betaproteobacteria bacterium]|nr:outer membrane protein assembly factor BamE [Betaproteobacteria bacterium]
MKILQRGVAAWAVMSSLAGCSQWSWDTIPGVSLLKPYSLDFEQGTVIDSEMVGRLREGMTRAQVAFALGTPLLQDPFHKNRWDYVYYVRKEGRLTAPHTLTVYFKDDKLERYETDYPPEKPVAPESGSPTAGGNNDKAGVVVDTPPVPQAVGGNSASQSAKGGTLEDGGGK